MNADINQLFLANYRHLRWSHWTSHILQCVAMQQLRESRARSLRDFTQTNQPLCLSSTSTHFWLEWTGSSVDVSFVL